MTEKPKKVPKKSQSVGFARSLYLYTMRDTHEVNPTSGWPIKKITRLDFTNVEFSIENSPLRYIVRLNKTDVIVFLSGQIEYYEATWQESL